MLSKTRVVLALALLLGLAAIAAIVTLERRAASSRSAQVSLANVSAQLPQLELIPLASTSIPGNTSQKIVVLKALMRGQEQTIRSTLDRLGRTGPPAELRATEAPVRTALAAAEEAIPVWVPLMPHSGPWPGIEPGMIPLLNRQGTTLVAALAALDRANSAYGSRASILQTEALGGSAGVVGILLAAFGFFFRRSELSRREIDAQRATLHEALAKLEAAQADRARLLERTIEVAEHERIRVAADLHDGPIQRLSAVTLGFDLLANQLERGDYERAETLIEQIRESLATETVALRRLMTELRPPILDERGLAAALTDCAQQVLGGTSVDWQVEAGDEAVSLAPEIETVAYRVVREALVNIRKHAPAAHVKVVLAERPEHVHVTIEDDGPGFDEEAPVGHTNGVRYGLIGMRERVESVGGDWRLDTAPGKGTRIELSLPCKLHYFDAHVDGVAGLAA
jgi:signal transduction histidine kinase